MGLRSGRITKKKPAQTAAGQSPTVQRKRKVPKERVHSMKLRNKREQKDEVKDQDETDIPIDKDNERKVKRVKRGNRARGQIDEENCEISKKDSVKDIITKLTESQDHTEAEEIQDINESKSCSSPEATEGKVDIDIVHGASDLAEEKGERISSFMKKQEEVNQKNLAPIAIVHSLSDDNTDAKEEDDYKTDKPMDLDDKVVVENQTESCQSEVTGEESNFHISSDGQKLDKSSLLKEDKIVDKVAAVPEPEKEKEEEMVVMSSPCPDFSQVGHIHHVPMDSNHWHDIETVTATGHSGDDDLERTNQKKQPQSMSQNNFDGVFGATSLDLDPHQNLEESTTAAAVIPLISEDPTNHTNIFLAVDNDTDWSFGQEDEYLLPLDPDLLTGLLTSGHNGAEVSH